MTLAVRFFGLTHTAVHRYAAGIQWSWLELSMRIHRVFKIPRVFYLGQLFAGLTIVVGINLTLGNPDKITMPIIFVSCMAPSFLSTIRRSKVTMITSLIGVFVGIWFVLFNVTILIGIPCGIVIAYAISIFFGYPGGLIGVAFGVIYVQIFAQPFGTPFTLVITRIGGILGGIAVALTINLMSPSLFTARFFHDAAGSVESGTLMSIPETVCVGPAGSVHALGAIAQFLTECDFQLAEWQLRGLHDKRTDLFKLRRHTIRLQMTLHLAVDLHHVLRLEANMTEKTFRRSTDHMVLVDRCLRRECLPVGLFEGYRGEDVHSVYEKLAALLDMIFVVDEKVLASLIPAVKVPVPGTVVIEAQPALSPTTFAAPPTARLAENIMIPMDYTETSSMTRKRLRRHLPGGG